AASAALTGASAAPAESENASNIIRRLSSPIFTASGFHRDHGGGGDGGGGGDSDGDDDTELDLEEAEGDGAERIQRWWRSRLLASKRTKAALAARPAFARLLQLLDKLDAGQMSFERTGLALQNPDIQRAVVAALAVVPRDETLIALPRASRRVNEGARGAVLSSTMIVYHQSEVLPPDDDGGVSEGKGIGGGGGGGKMDPAAAALRNASALMLASIKAVAASLTSVSAAEAGARKTLAVRLEVLRMSRRYFSVSLLRWKDKDAQRVAAQVVQPYARAFAVGLAAEAQGDQRVAEMVQGQLDQYR
ncbi:unnamed protein product, partial [Laminaria digitata]